MADLNGELRREEHHCGAPHIVARRPVPGEMQQAAGGDRDGGQRRQDRRSMPDQARKVTPARGCLSRHGVHDSACSAVSWRTRTEKPQRASAAIVSAPATREVAIIPVPGVVSSKKDRVPGISSAAT